jgi:hypothetical protein
MRREKNTGGCRDFGGLSVGAMLPRSLRSEPQKARFSGRDDSWCSGSQDAKGEEESIRLRSPAAPEGGA